MIPTLTRDRYVTPEWFALEQERIFENQWFCVGRSEEIPEPGDHLVCQVVGESVIVTRARDGSLHGYVNLCRHRGSMLTDAEGKPAQVEVGPTGTFHGSIQCAYYAWTYSFDGRLRAAPFLNEDDGLRKEDLPLHHVGVEAWGGFLWVHLAPEGAAPLGQQFQETESYLDNYRLDDLRTAVRIVLSGGFQLEGDRSVSQSWVRPIRSTTLSSSSWAEAMGTNETASNAAARATRRSVSSG